MPNQKSSERTVAFGYVDEKTVGEDMKSQVVEADTFSGPRIRDGVPEFTKVEDYTTFKAEYTMKDGDLVIHFFPGENKLVWKSIFAEVLDRVAQEHFKATAPRLQAKFTEEMNSWWFRARGYDHLVDFNAFVSRFFDLLDASLEAGVQ